MNSIYQIYKEESIPTLHKLFQKIREDGAILKSFPVSRVTQKTNPDKGISERELQAIARVTVLGHGLPQVSDKPNMATHTKWDMYQECRLISHPKINPQNIILIKVEFYTTISLDAEKFASDKNPTHFHDKSKINRNRKEPDGQRLWKPHN